jgi:hypothetical protein
VTSVSAEWITCPFTPGTRAQSPRHVLNGTARTAGTAQTEVVPNETKPQSLSDLKRGDVLVSHSSAAREHEISVIPKPTRCST